MLIRWPQPLLPPCSRCGGSSHPIHPQQPQRPVQPLSTPFVVSFPPPLPRNSHYRCERTSDRQTFGPAFPTGPIPPAPCTPHLRRHHTYDYPLANTCRDSCFEPERRNRGWRTRDDHLHPIGSSERRVHTIDRVKVRTIMAATTNIGRGQWSRIRDRRL